MYIIQEIQTINGVSSLLPAITKNNLNEAESSFHSILAAAAVSQIDIHSAIVYDEHGNIILSKYYEHLSNNDS